MHARFRLLGITGLTLVAVAISAAIRADDVAAPRFRHASLAAYPNAVVSLKDQRTELTFYVESDGRRLIALDQGGSLRWGVDVFAETKLVPSVGAPVIRHLGVEGGKLVALCGKHDVVTIDLKTGRCQHRGSD